MSFVQLTLTCEEEASQILIAELSTVGYDVFEETADGFITSTLAVEYNEEEVNEIIERYLPVYTITWESKEVERINWNDEWEKNYQPVEVLDLVFVRATFHASKPGFEHEIVIHPKMSFGTGHHDTTYLMLKNQCRYNHSGARVYDFGSGTGILAIMAGLLGASHIVGNDVDDWCIENANDNLMLNNVNAEMHLGSVKELGLVQQADIVLANINKNILLLEMENYCDLMKSDAKLLMSGFYETDIPDIRAHGEQLGLVLEHQEVKNRWAMVVFNKPS